MIPPRLFYIISFAIMLFTKITVILYMLSARDFEFLNWKNGQEYLQEQRVSPLNDSVYRCQVFNARC